MYVCNIRHLETCKDNLKHSLYKLENTIILMAILREEESGGKHICPAEISVIKSTQALKHIRD